MFAARGVGRSLVLVCAVVLLLAPAAFARSTNPSTRATCASLMSVPRSVAGSNGSPTLTASKSAAVRFTKSSNTLRWTYARVAAVQSWPPLMSAPAVAPRAAA